MQTTKPGQKSKKEARDPEWYRERKWRQETRRRKM